MIELTIMLIIFGTGTAIMCWLAISGSREDAKKEADKWQVAYSCSACETILNYLEVMDSHGICPYCGHNAKSTVCDYIFKAARKEAGKWVYK